MRAQPPTLIASSRRGFFLTAAGGIAAAMIADGVAHAEAALPTSANVWPDFNEHLVPRGEHKLYAREHPGEGPAFVLLHGFPDNLHIYDDLAPLLAKAGRRVIAFDFLGFGSSDKPDGYPYDFQQQQNDLIAVLDYLKVDQAIPVAHDAGGPSAINFSVSQPDRVHSLVLLNTFYSETTTLRFPELIALCADPALGELAKAIMTDQSKREWLLTFQNNHFEANATASQKERFNSVLQPIINANFAAKPSAGPAFMSMTADLKKNVASNGRQLARLRKFQKPVNLIWGVGDPYLNKGVASDLAALFPTAKLQPLELGHWPQVDDAPAVAKCILS